MVICPLDPKLAVAAGQQPAGKATVAPLPPVPPVNAKVGGTEYAALPGVLKYTETTLPLFTVIVKLEVVRAVPETSIPPVTVIVGAVAVV